MIKENPNYIYLVEMMLTVYYFYFLKLFHFYNFRFLFSKK